VLGETRRLVLQVKYDTVLVCGLKELAFLASGAPFDAIVLCHTLTVDERIGCLGFAQGVWPSARIVSVACGSQDTPPEFGTVVFGLEGPEALLNSVQQMLALTLPAIAPS
jgi:hypothetical protein